ncbi:MAG: TraR/DksA family transcriptional regulator [Streptosporangiaceae bacterium]
MDAETARKRLEELLSDLDRSLATLEGERPTENIQELAVYDQHPADSGSNLSEADRAEALREAARRQRVEVVSALDRVDQGTYGGCVDCGKRVPDGRLEARPEAARCVECQSKVENYK